MLVLNIGPVILSESRYMYVEYTYHPQTLIHDITIII